MNNYLTGIEGMPRLLDSCADPMPDFKRKVYAEAFQKKYQEHVPTFDAIEAGYNSVIDKEQFLTNMAEALAEHGAQLVNRCRRRSEREKTMMDLNLGHGGCSSFPWYWNIMGILRVRWRISFWKHGRRSFQNPNLQAAEFSYIEKGFHKKFCYITTAVCETLKKGDDCYELNLLRDYRDTYLASLPQGEELIRRYYDIAPTIVKHINCRDDAEEIYRSIWDTYLSPCIHMIESSRLESCRERYEEMVLKLQDTYFFQ